MKESRKSAVSWALVVVLIAAYWAWSVWKPKQLPTKRAFNTVYEKYTGPEDAVPQLSQTMNILLEADGFEPALNAASADVVMDVTISDDQEPKAYPIFVTSLEADFTLPKGKSYRQHSCVGIMPGEMESGIRATEVASRFRMDNPSLTSVSTRSAQINGSPAVLQVVDQEFKAKGIQVVAEPREAQAVLKALRITKHLIRVGGTQRKISIKLSSTHDQREFGYSADRYYRSMSESTQDPEPERTRLCNRYLSSYLDTVMPGRDQEFLRAALDAVKYLNHANANRAK
jgi:hypothetical protein